MEVWQGLEVRLRLLASMPEGACRGRTLMLQVALEARAAAALGVAAVAQAALWLLAIPAAAEAAQAVTSAMVAQVVQLQVPRQ